MKRWLFPAAVSHAAASHFWLLGVGLLLTMAVGCRLLYDRKETVSSDGQTNVVYSVRPAISNGLNTASEAASHLPSPWGDLATGALGVTATVLGVVAKRKSTMLNATVAGVEAANHPATKAAIQHFAAAAGVDHHLDRAVRKVTRRMGSTIAP